MYRKKVNNMIFSELIPPEIPETFIVGDKQYERMSPKPDCFYVGDLLLVEDRELGKVVGVVTEIFPITYHAFGKVEVESPPEYAGKTIDVFAGKVVKTK